MSGELNEYGRVLQVGVGCNVKFLVYANSYIGDIIEELNTLEINKKEGKGKKRLFVEDEENCNNKKKYYE